MVDRQARNKLAEEVRHFVGGFTINFDYDDAAFDIDTKDKGVIDIRDEVWLTYDDLRKHKMKGDWALNQEQMDIVKRSIVFLKSDCEYKWPKWPFYYKFARPFIWLLSFGKAPKYLDGYLHRFGDKNVWPFFSVHQYELAKAEPVYCTNSS